MTTRRELEVNARAKPGALSAARYEQMREEATVDADGESEQLGGWLACLEEHLAFPFPVTLFGVTVQVTGLDQDDVTDAPLFKLRLGDERMRVPVQDLVRLRPRPRPAGWDWVRAYWRWVGE